MVSLCINNIFALLTLLLFVFNCDANAEATNHHVHSQNLSYRSRTQHGFAQRFTTRLNLSSGDDANNIVQDDPLNNEILAKNPFIFPSLSGHHNAAGYFKLRNTSGPAGMFYFFFEAKQKKTTAPVVVYLSGGPGCSGSIALFYENGPFKVSRDLSLVLNKDGNWDQVGNIIFVDQPIGTGFSYYTDKDDIPTTSEEAAVHFYDFLQAFFEKHPELAKNALYLTGQSYAGHYVPAFAAWIINENKKKPCDQINLQGIVIGSGWTNPGVQIATYRDYALNMKLINKSQYKNLTKQVKNCSNEVKSVCTDGTHFNFTACAQVYIDCNDIYETITDLNPDLNPLDIRKKCTGSTCYDFSRMEHFLNRRSVKRALGVDVRRSFASCSGAVYDAMAGDEMRNLAIYIPRLLKDGIKLLLYGGEYDFLCNWLGNSEWVHEMKWSGQRRFNAAAYTPFIVDGVEVGSQKGYGNLTFLKINNAGHLVPMDQPKPVLEMLRRWIKGLTPL